jgi:hypothetical protein
MDKGWQHQSYNKLWKLGLKLEILGSNTIQVSCNQKSKLIIKNNVFHLYTEINPILELWHRFQQPNPTI